MKRFVKRFLGAAVALVILVSAIGCGVTAPRDPENTQAPTATQAPAATQAPSGSPSVSLGTADLMAGITAHSLSAPKAPEKAGISAAADFGMRLFKACAEDGVNTLVSPLSVISALSMTVNGANGETLSQMEAVLGMSRDELNEFWRGYSSLLPSGEKYKLSLANSIWFTADDRFTVNEEFLQTNADYYGADIYKAPFDDSTLNDINAWVREKTDGMIPKVLDKLSSSAVMCLINALAFDAEWQHIYSESDVWEGEFTLESGEKKKTEFMHSDEYTYLTSENARGFIKYYSGGKYAFAALLPNEGVTVAQLVDSLDGEKLTSILSNAENEHVVVKMPKFKTEYSVSLSDALRAMGMEAAFDQGAADFSGLGTSTGGNIFVSDVLHKTFISVDERGTKAGAATAVIMSDGAALETPPSVYLDRPFLYMLIDTETNLPFFIGTMMDVG